MRKKIYFASDFHLGMPTFEESITRERKIVSWLDIIKLDAKSIYLIGDVFDFWFEYKRVVPKGFVRLLGKIAELSDNGIKIYFSIGNHDLWVKDYFETEIGMKVLHKSIVLEENGKKIFVSHGDGLGRGDYAYKFLRVIFTSKICQWLFARLHPNFAIKIAHLWSKNSRKKKGIPFKDPKNEILFNYCKKHQDINPVDYYIFGHRHLPLEISIDNNCKYINVGDWINHFTYAVFDGESVKVKKYK